MGKLEHLEGGTVKRDKVPADEAVAYLDVLSGLSLRAEQIRS
ncbi:hypothetical protein ACFL5O_07360 [Myxococcota bacterium]